MTTRLERSSPNKLRRLFVARFGDASRQDFTFDKETQVRPWGKPCIWSGFTLMFLDPPTEIRKEIPGVFRIKQSRSAGVFAGICSFNDDAIELTFAGLSST